MIFQSFNLITRSSVINNVLTSNVPDMPWWKTFFGYYTKEQKLKALEALDKVLGDNVEGSFKTFGG